MKLFMLLLGCKPKNRNIEQHDIYFGVGESIVELVPAITTFWKEGKANLHVDAWREVTCVDGYRIEIVPEDDSRIAGLELFFINLGGYKQNEFEEYHYKMLTVAMDKAAAVAQAKQTAFYKHTGFKGAPAHIDQKYAIDVDDIYTLPELLFDASRYRLHIIKNKEQPEDEVHLGYFKLADL